MAVHQGPEDQINEQVREFLQAVTKRSDRPPILDICNLGDRDLGIQVPGMRVRRGADGRIANYVCDFARRLEP